MYRYTVKDHVLAIKREGLLPRPCPAMSPDSAVVWLTTQPDVSVTPKAANWCALYMGMYEGDLAELLRPSKRASTWTSKPDP